MGTQAPTFSIVSFFNNWETSSARELLAPINQGFLHCLISMQHYSGLPAKVHSEHGAVDFGELANGKEMQIVAKKVPL